MNGISGKPHPLVRLALLLSPAEFRRHYAREIYEDAKNDPVHAAADALFAGLGMRVEDLFRNIRRALRSLARSPIYALTVMVALTLAIGANVAVGSVLKGVLLDPLPFPNASRLVSVGETPSDTSLSYPEAVDILAQSKTLAGIALANDNTSTLTGLGRPAGINVRTINGDYFSVLGAQAILGRLIFKSDLAKHVAVISPAFSDRVFGKRAFPLGRTLRLDGTNYTIIGIVQPEFRDPSMSATDVWIPLDPHNTNMNGRGDYIYAAVARLRPGIAYAQARADLSRIVRRQTQSYPVNHGRFSGANVEPIAAALFSRTGTLLWILYAGVAVVLLIACANVTNLNVMRSSARSSELYVRSAIGGSARRIAIELSFETLLIALVSALLGLALGTATLYWFARWGAQTLPRWDNVSVDWNIACYALGIALFTTVVSAVLPAFVQRRDTAAALRTVQGRHSGFGSGLRWGLLIGEIALALALVVTGGLLLRSFTGMTHRSVGFDGTNLYDVNFNGLPASYYSDPAKPMQFGDRILQSIAEITGVTGSAVAWTLPFDDAGENWTGLHLPGRPDPHASTNINVVSPGYFSTMRMPLLYGRDFSGADNLRGRPVAIVDRHFARQFFGTANIVGRLIQPGNCGMWCGVHRGGFPDLTVVGVVADSRSSFTADYTADTYFPLAQNENFGHFIVRTNGSRIDLAQQIDRIFARVDPQLASPIVTPYSALFHEDALSAEAYVQIFGLLAIVALVLALAGTYAVSAYATEQRMQEFGIRRALGAQNVDIVRGVLRQALVATVIGAAIGLVLTALSARVIATLLFRTSATDLPTYGAALLLITACAVVAALVPALRAARVDPAVALRYE